LDLCNPLVNCTCSCNLARSPASGQLKGPPHAGELIRGLPFPTKKQVASAFGLTAAGAKKNVELNSVRRGSRSALEAVEVKLIFSSEIRATSFVYAMIG
jgi:hypothetical protein